MLLVPLTARGRTFGVLTLVMAESMRRFDDADREFAEQVAGRAAVAVDNARLATSRRQTADTLQRSLLPDTVPPIGGWTVATFYRAARVAEEIEVGGDFYDFYDNDDAWIVLLGDVTGKGVEAAALTSLVRHGARFLSKYERSPSRILVRLNEALSEQPGLWLCTAVCVRLHREEAVIASAGHPPALIVRDDGRVREIGTEGPILGAWTGELPVDRTVPVGAGRDAVPIHGRRHRHARRARPVRCPRAQAAAGRARCAAPERLLAELEAGLDRFQVGPQADDTAALALRPVPVASGAGAARRRIPCAQLVLFRCSDRRRRRGFPCPSSGSTRSRADPGPR